MLSASGTTAPFGDRYRLERELGRGGMATVFLCTDTRLGRPVAIKVLHPDLAAAVGAERFHREIKIATGLSHPNILPAFDSGQTDQGALFYVMPVVDGESLRERLNRDKQLSVEETIRIATHVAHALHHAHSHGIVHRDIKPENILFQGDQAVVADFGIARAITSASDVEALTQTGVSVGTPAYMSPEQAMGERNIDGRADQYSLGCVMYEMLVGQPPFIASSLQMLVMKHVTEPVALITSVRPSVPEELEDVVLRALEKVPADRFPSVGALAEALEAIVATTGTWARRTPTRTAQMRATMRRHPTPPPGLLRRNPRAAVAGAALTVALLVVAGAWTWRLANPPAADTNAANIAVLYFDDESRDARLRHLADGLTESLIERLADVPTLNVVSRNGVLPVRGKPVRLDSLAQALDVGSIVRGTIEPAEGGAQITVRLHDGSGGKLDQRGFTYDSGSDQPMAVADAIAEQVAVFLQDRIGAEVRLRERKRATKSADAWMLVQRAEQRAKDADSLLLAGQPQPALAALAVADSLLASAERADPRWSTPPALRAAAALTRAQTAPRDPALLRAIVDSGLAHADRALAADGRNADALEYRGKLLYFQIGARLVSDARESDRVLTAAESTLMRAVSLNKYQAGAWDALSALHYRKPDLQQVMYATEKAYEADIYGRSARQILWRGFLAAYNIELFPEALSRLERFHRRFPNDPLAIEGRLYMYRARGQKPDIDSAWAYLEEYVRRTPEPRRAFARKKGEVLVAGAIARASLGGDARLADSARAVLLRARVADRTFDPRRDLPASEASVRVMLRDYDIAVELLRDYLTVNPDHRRGFVNRSSWFWRDLQSHPRFEALVASL